MTTPTFPLPDYTQKLWKNNEAGQTPIMAGSLNKFETNLDLLTDAVNAVEARLKTAEAKLNDLTTRMANVEYNRSSFFGLWHWANDGLLNAARGDIMGNTKQLETCTQLCIHDFDKTGYNFAGLVSSANVDDNILLRNVDNVNVWVRYKLTATMSIYNYVNGKTTIPVAVVSVGNLATGPFDVNAVFFC